MSGAQHTPGWYVADDGSVREPGTGGAPRTVALVGDQEDAARIVQCVNAHDGLVRRAAEDRDLIALQRGLIERLEAKLAAHDGLVEALRKAEARLDRIYHQAEGAMQTNDLRHLRTTLSCIADDAVGPDRAALALQRTLIDKLEARVNAHAGLVKQALASRLAGQGEHPAVPDDVWEALQRLIENGSGLGPSSHDDAMLVARWRGQFLRAGKGEQPSDMRAVCAALGFDPTNHHNAAKCPYCRSPEGEQPAPAADLRNALHAAVSALGSVLAEPDRNLEQRPERRAQVRAAYDAGRAALSAPAPAGDAPVRCQLCDYQYGHAIGCANNPVDLALRCEGAPVAAFVPAGWLYDWVHSSALGKPDEHFTGFTEDEAHARKHDNVRRIYLAASPTVPAPVDPALRAHLIPPRRAYVPPEIEGPERRASALREAMRFVWRPRLYLAVGAIALAAGFVAARFL